MKCSQGCSVVGGVITVVSFHFCTITDRMGHQAFVRMPGSHGFTVKTLAMALSLILPWVYSSSV